MTMTSNITILHGKFIKESINERTIEFTRGTECPLMNIIFEIEEDNQLPIQVWGNKIAKVKENLDKEMDIAIKFKGNKFTTDEGEIANYIVAIFKAFIF